MGKGGEGKVYRGSQKYEIEKSCFTFNPSVHSRMFYSWQWKV